MDPDLALLRLTSLVEDLRFSTPSREDGIAQLEAIIEQATDLAEWLRKLGALPEDWEDSNVA